MAALSFIGCKHIYKSGQIDQKYTDKAKIEKHQKQISESTELEIELVKLKEQIKVIENLISAQKSEINK